MLNKLSNFILLLAIAGQCAAQIQHDPTQPGQRAAANSTSASQATAYRLSAIFYSQTVKQAVVNDALVTVNDKVGGARVAAIMPDAVRLVVSTPQGNQPLTVKLASASVKRRASEDF